MRTLRRFALPFSAFLVLAVARAGEPVRVVEDGLLDEIKLYAETLPKASTVVVRTFDTSKAELGTGAEGGKDTRVAAAKQIQAAGPKLLSDSFVSTLVATGTFKTVRADDQTNLPEDALVVTGRFTQIDPGSKAKRYWAGFTGAGRSGTSVEGAVTDASGHVLATFKQQHIAVMGVFGGDYVKKMTSDCRSLGEDLAVFVNTWATGRVLKIKKEKEEEKEKEKTKKK